MMDRRYFYKDLLPLVVLVANECNNTALFTLFKAATLQGMSSYVFVSYAYSLAFLVLLPVTLLYRRFHANLIHTCFSAPNYELTHFNDSFSCLFADQEWFPLSVFPSFPKLLFLES